MPEIILETSGWWILPILVAAVLTAVLFYFTGKSFSRGQRIFLAGLRFLLFFLLGLLLLSPLMKNTERLEEKPLLLWIEDHSSSMLAGNDSSSVKEFLQGPPAIKEALEEKYELVEYDFSLGLHKKQDSLSSAGTDISDVLNEIRERHYRQNVGAAVLATDGIYNRGSNPSYLASSLSYPLYTLGFGDTTARADLFVDRVVHNDVSYLGNEFPVEIYVRARELEGRPYRLQVSSADGQKLYEKDFKIASDDYFERADLFLKAGELGLNAYTVSLSPLEGEQSQVNNSARFTVNVLDDREKIWIVGGGAHPDLAAITSALEDIDKYDVKSLLAFDNLEQVKPEDLIILHNPDLELLNDLDPRKRTCWVLTGPSTPLRLLLGTGNNAGSFEDVSPELNTSFDLFSLTDEEMNFCRDLPPLWSPFGRLELSQSIYPLFTKKVGNVSTAEPLWFFEEKKGEDSFRKVYTLGTGLWRWRIHNYRQKQNHEAFDGLVAKTVQYLLADVSQKRFVVDMARSFEQTQAVRGEARLFNKAGQLVNEPEVKISFTDKDDNTFDFNFSAAGRSYKLNAGRLPEGIYRWKATTELGDESFSAEGSIAISRNQVEQQDLVARHGELRKIARESGGGFYHPAEMAQLQDNLLQNTEAKSYQRLETSTTGIIEKKWLFFLLLIIMAAEWGFRKYFGRY